MEGLDAEEDDKDSRGPKDIAVGAAAVAPVRTEDVVGRHSSHPFGLAGDMLESEGRFGVEGAGDRLLAVAQVAAGQEADTR